MNKLTLFLARQYTMRELKEKQADITFRLCRLFREQRKHLRSRHCRRSFRSLLQQQKEVENLIRLKNTKS